MASRYEKVFIMYQAGVVAICSRHVVLQWLHLRSVYSLRGKRRWLVQLKLCCSTALQCMCTLYCAIISVY